MPIEGVFLRGGARLMRPKNRNCASKIQAPILTRGSAPARLTLCVQTKMPMTNRSATHLRTPIRHSFISTWWMRQLLRHPSVFEETIELILRDAWFAADARRCIDVR
jgi:hypothetical protein